MTHSVTTRRSAELKAGEAGSTEKKVNPALMKPLQPSKELAAVVGSDPLPRPQVVKKLWEYIKKNDLQNPEKDRKSTRLIQSLMRTSYAVFCLKKKTTTTLHNTTNHNA